jgi:hypothetical protein
MFIFYIFLDIIFNLLFLTSFILISYIFLLILLIKFQYCLNIYHVHIFIGITINQSDTIIY